MATEKLLPNAKTGWSGGVGNIDEGIASADGLVVSVANTSIMTVDFDASAVLDNDTVTLVRPTIRVKSDTLSGADTLKVDLFIGGVKKGVTQTFVLTSTFQNHVFSHSGWDVDWTASEMDGIQIKCQASHADGAEPDPIATKIDAIDLDITYTIGPINHTITGDVTTTFTPAATLDFQRHASITGNVTTSFTPTATLAFNKKHVLVGDVTTTFIPAATLNIGRTIVGAITTNFNPDAAFDLTVAGGVNELLAPDVLLSDSGHSACVLSDLTADDANWCLAATKTSNTVSHVDFPAPTNLLQIGAGFQKIKAIVRQSSLNDPSSPSARIELWENGSLIRAGSNQNVPATGTRTLTLAFNANELTDQHGQLVQVKVITTADSEPGFSGAVDTGFIEFNARFIPINNNAIVGAVTTSFTPAATTEYHRRIIGAITTTFTPAATMVKGKAIVGAITTSFTPEANFDLTIGGGTTEILVPDTKIADSGHSACLLSDLTVDDANWCIATGITFSTISHVGYPTPSELLEIGANLQKITAIVRQFSGNDPSLPTARIELWENGSLVRAGPNQTVGPTGTKTLTFNFNANELTDTSGVNAEAKVITVADTEPGFSGAVDTGYIAFTARLATVHTLVGAISTSFTPTAITEYRSRIVGNITTTFVPAATFDFTLHTAITGDITLSFTPNAQTEFVPFGGIRETLVPDGLIADSGHSACTLSDLTADDANWCLAATKTASTIAHVDFPTPTNPLEVGANFQKLIGIVRQSTLNDVALPSARLELWENGSFVLSGSNQNVAASGTTTLTLFFNANVLSNVDGSRVQVKVITTADTEPGFSGSVDTGYIAFDARLNPAARSIVGNVTTSFIPAAVLVKSKALVGAITTTFVPAATMEHQRHFAIVGAVTTTLIPAATFEFRVGIIGDITTTFIPAAVMDFTLHASFVGSITISFSSAAVLLFGGLPQFRKVSTEKLQIVRLTAKRRFKFFNTRSQ